MIYSYLYDWQKKLVDKIKDKKSYGLWLTMGLGKTPLSLSLCEKNKVDKIIIITINSKATETQDVKGSWFDWCSKMDKHYDLLTKKNIDKLDPNKPQVLMINYEWLINRKIDENKFGIQLREEVLNFAYSCGNQKVALILDESHKIKSTKSAQTKCVQKLYNLLNKIADCYLYLLTGTPFTQGYIDLYTQLRLLGMKMNKGQFKDEFCIMDNRYGLLGWQQPIKAYKNLDELFNLVHKYAITIKSSEVVDLPQQFFINQTYKQTDAITLFTSEYLYPNEIIKYAKEIGYKGSFEAFKGNSKINNPFFRRIDYPSYEWEADTPSQFWLRCRELSIGFQGNSETYKIYDRTRLNMLKSFLTNNEDNYLLFYSYNAELCELFDLCNDLQYNIDVYSGALKSITNYNNYAKLSDGEKMATEHKNIILANWQSGSTGVNFQAYNKCIIFDLPTYKDWEQGIKRIHRIGQKEPCFYYIFMQNNWLDLSMKKAIDEKREYTKDTFESDLKRVQEILKGE